MKVISYLKKNGIKRAIEVFYRYKLDKIFIKIILLFIKNKKCKNIIVIESHNDFDSNGGAFYNYLINNRYNFKYKIVWLLKNKNPKHLPYNTVCFPLHKPSIIKDYYICMAKFFTADCVVVGKVRKEQKSYYLTHGAFSLKKVSGKINLQSCVDYALIPSEFTREIQKNQINPQQNTKMISLGFPVHDQLLSPCVPQLHKMDLSKVYDKVIIWMPTFRKGGGYDRNDSCIEQPLGIPLINCFEQLIQLNNLLEQCNTLFIIKIHPMQDFSTVHIHDLSNIKLLTGKTVKELKIDNYELLKETDALISDYSSITFDYLFLNKPIGYNFSDLKEYKIGLVTNTPEELMAGPIINTLDQLKKFILDVVNNNDFYCEQRQKLKNKIFEFSDGKACERLVNSMGL